MSEALPVHINWNKVDDPSQLIGRSKTFRHLDRNFTLWFATNSTKGKGLKVSLSRQPQADKNEEFLSESCVVTKPTATNLDQTITTLLGKFHQCISCKVVNNKVAEDHCEDCIYDQFIGVKEDHTISCTICQENINKKPFCRNLLEDDPCDHLFHTKCLERYAELSDFPDLECPICRMDYKL